MEPTLQKYYENRLSMCGEEAWKDLMEDIQKMRDATDTVAGIKDEKSLFIRQGEIRMMDWFLSIADVSEQTYLTLKNEGAST